MAAVDPSDADRRVAQQVATRQRTTPGLLPDCHTGTAGFLHPGGNQELVVQPRRTVVLQCSLDDDEHAAAGFAQGLLFEAGGAQPFGTGPFEIFQIVGMEHHAAGVGVFPVDPNRPRKGGVRMDAVFGLGAVRVLRHPSSVCRRATAVCRCAMELALEKRM
jgi:hypothetical protein